MLKNILSKESCASCRLCCVFDRYDVWETPVFTEYICERIRYAKPDAEFVAKDDGFIFKVKELDENELNVLRAEYLRSALPEILG